jgi:hypothetical protein
MAKKISMWGGKAPIHRWELDAAAMDRMLDAISGLRLTAMASASENYAIYDLQEGERVQVTAFKREDLLLSIDIGKAAPSHRHTFVKLAGDSRVYHAEKNLRSSFDKEASALRDKQVMKIDEEVSEVILTAGKNNLHILRATAGAEVNSDQAQAEDRGEGRRGRPAQGDPRREAGARERGRQPGQNTVEFEV